MVRQLVVIFALLHFASIAGCSDSDPGQLAAKADAPDEIGLSVLRSTDYAAIVRATIKRDCDGFAIARLPAVCSDIATVPDSVIEHAALPFFKRHVSVEQAEAALEFWSSRDGAEISKTLVKEIATRNPTLLNHRQLAELDRFNKSDAGVALGRVADDRELSPTVLRAIEAYAP